MAMKNISDGFALSAARWWILARGRMRNVVPQAPRRPKGLTRLKSTPRKIGRLAHHQVRGAVLA
jgi:hypothetical protein